VLHSGRSQWKRLWVHWRESIQKPRGSFQPEGSSRLVYGKRSVLFKNTYRLNKALTWGLDDAHLCYGDLRGIENWPIHFCQALDLVIHKFGEIEAADTSQMLGRMPCIRAANMSDSQCSIMSQPEHTTQFFVGRLSIAEAFDVPYAPRLHSWTKQLWPFLSWLGNNNLTTCDCLRPNGRVFVGCQSRYLTGRNSDQSVGCSHSLPQLLAARCRNWIDVADGSTRSQAEAPPEYRWRFLASRWLK